MVKTNNMTDHIGDANKKVTAVEWLFIQLYLRFEMKGDGREMDKVLEQAKAMEKGQIIQAHLSGLLHPLEMEATKQAEQYYNETYKNK